MSSARKSQPPIASHTICGNLDDSTFLALLEILSCYCLAHPVIKDALLTLPPLTLRRNLTSFLAHLLGGLHYDRARLRAGHQGIGLNDAHYDAVMECLTSTFRTKKPNDQWLVRPELADQVLNLAESLREQIIRPGAIQGNWFISRDTFDEEAAAAPVHQQPWQGKSEKKRCPMRRFTKSTTTTTFGEGMNCKGCVIS